LADTGPLARFACSDYLPVFLRATKHAIDPVSTKSASSVYAPRA
jgi:hypothetical protein